MRHSYTTSIFSLITILLLLNISCGRDTDEIDSGTYKGTVENISAEQSEIFISTDDNKMLQLYFTDETQVVQSDTTPTKIDQLKQGQQVRATVEKVGQRLHLVKAEIIQ